MLNSNTGDSQQQDHADEPNQAFQQYVPQENAQVTKVDFQPTGQYVADGQSQAVDLGQYEGDTNAQGQREGNGRVTWLDGSEYVGEFRANMRNGTGRYSRKDGYTYDGDWVNDMMQGKGTVTTPNKEVIVCTFEAGRIHGEGTYTDASGNTINANWNYDLMIPEGNQDEQCTDRFILSLLLFLGVIGSLVYALFIAQHDSDEQSGLIAAGVLYLIYLCECCCSRTNQYTRNIESSKTIRQVIMTAKLGAPQISFHIQCYHYEHRTRVVHYEEDGHQRQRVEHYKERVNTHFARAPYRFTAWSDTSPPEVSMDFVAKIPLTRLRQEKRIDYSPEARASFNWQRDHFIWHNRRDIHYEFHIDEEIQGHRDFVLMYNDELGSKPWFTDNCTFWGLSLAGLGWYQRYCFMVSTKKVVFPLSKYIYA
jgi:hypothetical protein